MKKEFSVGEVVSKDYEVLEHIGQGGFSDVYKAFNRRLNRIVAIKVYHGFDESVVRELDILKELRHPNLPQVYDFVITEKEQVLVMEYIEGLDLLFFVKREGILLPNVAIKILYELCDVVEYLHQRQPQIIHGDIKPNNIILRPTGEICLIDYNLSQAYNNFMWPIGRTNGYSPPEFYYPKDWEALQDVRDKKITTAAMPVDEEDIFQSCWLSSDGKIKTTQLLTVQSDIYSIGATLYYCLTGTHPWPYRRINVSRVNKTLGKIILRCLQHVPKDRFSSTKLLLTELQSQKSYEYDVAVSFAGENRNYVREVVRHLKLKGLRVFYDESEQENLWGKNLYQYLDVIYQKRAKYCIVFISEYYKRKLWTKHEIQSVFARTFIEDRDYMLPVLFDDTELPGMRITTGYLDGRVLSPENIAEAFLKKLIYESK